MRQSLSLCLGSFLGSADRVHLYTVSQAVPPSCRPVFKADPPAVQITAQGFAARGACSLCDPPTQPAGPRGGPPCNSLLQLISPLAHCRTPRGHATHTRDSGWVHGARAPHRCPNGPFRETEAHFQDLARATGTDRRRTPETLVLRPGSLGSPTQSRTTAVLRPPRSVVAGIAQLIAHGLARTWIGVRGPAAAAARARNSRGSRRCCPVDDWRLAGEPPLSPSPLVVRGGSVAAPAG